MRDYLYSLRTGARTGQGCRLTRAERGERGVRSGISPRGDARRWGSENGKLGRCDEGLKKRKRERAEKKNPKKSQTFKKEISKAPALQ